MSVRVEIKSDLDFGGLNDLMTKYINKRLGHIGYRLAKYAQDNHRYTHRTGNLKASTRYWVNKTTSKLRLYISEQQAEYGVFIHEGHGTWSPDRFIDNAILQNRVWIDTQIKEATDEAVAEWNRINR